MENDSGAAGRERREGAGDDLFFPSDGHFSRVVPLSRAGDEAAPTSEDDGEVAPPVVAASAPEEADEREEATVVSARVRRGTLPARAPRPKKAFEQSWGFMAAVLALSVTAGVAAGAYMIRSQHTAETLRRDTPGVEAAAANGAVEKVVAAEPAEQPVPQPSAPQVEHDRLAAANAPAAPPASDEADEADSEVESANPPAPSAKASARAADTAPRRVVEPEPRAERSARAAPEARAAAPAPRAARSDAAPRHADRPVPANASRPERSLPISSPPPSARPKKVIQWP